MSFRSNNDWLKYRMSKIRASSRVAARRDGLSGLGFDWGGLLNTAVSYKVQDLQSRRAEANARLRAAQDAAAAAAAAPAPVVYQPATVARRAMTSIGGLPLIPLAIGAVGLLGLGFMLLRKKH